MFGRKNYFLILASSALLVFGYLLMTGSRNANMEVFNTDIYSFRRITLAPIFLLTGYILMIYAIMSVSGKENKKKNGISR
jgi:hypothetical protein